MVASLSCCDSVWLLCLLIVLMLVYSEPSGKTILNNSAIIFPETATKNPSVFLFSKLTKASETELLYNRASTQVEYIGLDLETPP